MTLRTSEMSPIEQLEALGDSKPPPNQLIPQNSYNSSYSAVVEITLGNSHRHAQITTKI